MIVSTTDFSSNAGSSGGAHLPVHGRYTSVGSVFAFPKLTRGTSIAITTVYLGGGPLGGAPLGGGPLAGGPCGAPGAGAPVGGAPLRTMLDSV